MATVPVDFKIDVHHITRVEGHGKVSILLDEQDKVTQARLHIVKFRIVSEQEQVLPSKAGPV